MAKPQTNEPDTTQATPEVAPVKETTPKTPAEKTLPELMAGIVQSCIEDPRKLPQAYRDMEMWYNSQPLDGRRELIPVVVKQIENGKLTLEALFGQFKMISQRDL